MLAEMLVGTAKAIFRHVKDCTKKYLTKLFFNFFMILFFMKTHIFYTME